MLRYVEKLTRTPGEMTESDVVALRDVGFTERDILDICAVASYYAYVNRIADGLGVQMETWLSEDR
jgi:alkylhydroperoxidase family enzyme